MPLRTYPQSNAAYIVPRPFALTGYLTAAAFLTYFCMYAFRKPFAAATYGDVVLAGTTLKLKTALVLGQLIGYASSKFLGIKFCTEAGPNRRGRMLIGCIALAEMALVVFAVVPAPWKIVAIFFNGLPLGMVWGLVVAYLEGRRTSEVLLAGLSSSFIVSSGVVKDVGVSFLNYGIVESWMPAAVGTVFLAPFVFGVWLLERAPPPDAADIAERVRREPMDGGERSRFLRCFWPGLAPLLLAYFFLTAFRDYRDNYGVELYSELGYQHQTALFARSEIPVALSVLGLLMWLSFVRDNRRALAIAYLLMGSGLLLAGLATWLLWQEAISGFAWMLLIGFGSYLAYVPINSMLFDRLIASTGFIGTAVFAIYVADAVGYVGALGVQLHKDLSLPQTSRLAFMQVFCVALALGGAALLAGSWWYFRNRNAGPGNLSLGTQVTQHVVTQETLPLANQ